jgi:hypothetical protein
MATQMARVPRFRKRATWELLQVHAVSTPGLDSTKIFLFFVVIVIVIVILVLVSVGILHISPFQ